MIRTFAPEWSASELAAVARCLVRGDLMRGAEVSHLEAELSVLADGHPVIATDSGRGALLAILSALGLPEGAEVIVPSMICEVAIFPILKAGLRPIFVDCLEDLTMDPSEVAAAISPSSRVLLMPHIYGKLCCIERLVRMAAEHRLILIDDAAQVPGGRYADHALGTLGDFGIFSFNYKQICSMMGGAIVLGRQHQQFESAVRPRRLRRSRAMVALSGLYMATKRFTWRSAPFAAVQGTAIAVGVSEQPSPDAVEVGAMSNLCAAVARAQLRSLSRRRQRRIDQAEQVAEYLARVDEAEVTRGRNGDLFTRLVLRLHMDKESLEWSTHTGREVPAEALVRFARKSGVEFQRIYRPFHLRIAGHKPLPQSERQYEQCVVLPNHALLRQQDVRRIVSVVERFIIKWQKGDDVQ